MKKFVASVRDQKEPKRQASADRHNKMVSINRESNKPRNKSEGVKKPKSGEMPIADPLLLNSPSTHVGLDSRIAERAYELWKHRGGHHGQDLEDWLTAEREVLSEESCCS